MALLLLASAGCGWQIGAPGAGSGALLNVDVRVELERAPALYEPVNVKVTVWTRREVYGPVEAWLELPPSAVFINGQMHWQGELAEGQTHTFETTIAFVVEGSSSVSAIARFASTPAKSPGADTVGHSEGLFVTEEGGAPRPTGPALASSALGSSAQNYNPSYTPYDGSVLLNKSASPRVMVVHNRSGLAELRRQGLVPADLWGGWQGKSHTARAGVLDGEWDNVGVLVFLYDRQRPTTGYHFAFLRPEYELRLGYEPIKPVPVGTPRPTGPRPVFLNILSTAPKPDWAVEQREVSPYQVRLISYPFEGRANELVVQVNGEEVGRYTVDRAATSPSFKELTLASFEEMKLP